MKKQRLRLLIAGHIDHGKSTLIGRLLLDTNSLPDGKLSEIKKISREFGKSTELAYLSDQLKEEREGNLTIDTTQIFFSTKKRNFVIIDTPGHSEFLKNMMTGASHAECAVLVIDVNEGIREQTMRHAYIIDMMGIDNIIVVLNKMDKVDYDRAKFDRVNCELAKALRSFNPEIKIIPISAKNGDNVGKRSGNMPWYKGFTLLEALESVNPNVKVEKLPLRFMIQDIYEIDGKKLIAGKVITGTIKKGDSVIFLPSLKRSKVESIEVFGRRKIKAFAGENIGIFLKDSSGAERGEIIVREENFPIVTGSFVGNIFWLAKEPLEKNQRVILRCSAQEFKCVIEKIVKRVNTVTLEIMEDDADKMSLNEAGEVVFKPEKTVVLEKFSFIEELGRFVVVRENSLAGAGIVKGCYCS